jgi:TP901 family phage tail tape measure protein
MADELVIKILGNLDVNKTESAIKTQLSQLEGKLNVQLGVDTKLLTQVAKQVKALQDTVNQQGKNIKLIDDQATIKSVDTIQNGVGRLFTSIEKAVAEYSKLGTVKVTSNLNPLTNQVDNFTLSLKKADGTLSNLKYSLAQMYSGKNLIPAYEISKSNVTDNSQAVNEKIIQQENAINNTLQERKKQQDTLNQQLQKELELYQKAKSMQVQSLSTNKYIDQSALASQLGKANNPPSFTTNKDFTNWQREVDQGFKQIKVNADEAKASSSKFGESLKTAFMGIGVWSIAATGVYSIVHGIQDAVKQTIALDTQMTQLRRVWNGTFNQSDAMQTSIDLAGKLGAKISDINTSMIEFAKQGFSGIDLKQITEYSTLLSQVSDMTSKDASNALTASLKGFNLEASKGLHIVDALNQVDNDYAVNSKDLALALAKSAGSAKTYGASLEDIIGYTTAVGEVTQESGNVLGNFEKSLFARITSNSKAIKELASIGVDTKNSAGEMRNVSDILAEVAGKWSGLSKAQQESIGVNVAGQYQLSRFLVLMQRFKTAQAATKDALDSNGSAYRENGIYMDSYQAKVNRLSNAWTEFTVAMQKDVLGSGINDATAGLTGLTTVLTSVVDHFGLLPPLFGLLGAGLLGVSGKFKTLATTMVVGTEKMTATQLSTIGLEQGMSRAAIAADVFKVSLRGLMVASVVGIAFAAIGVAVEGIVNAFSKYSEHQQKVKTETDNLTQSYANNKDQIDGLVAKYSEMSDKVNKGILPSTDKEYLATQQQLYKLLPSVADNVDKNGQAHLRSADAVKQEVLYLKQLSTLDAKKFVDDFSKNVGDITKQINDLQKQIDNLNNNAPKGTVAFDKAGVKKPELSVDDQINQMINQKEMSALVDQTADAYKKLGSVYAQSLGYQNGLNKSDQTYINTLVDKNKNILNTKDGMAKVEEEIKAFVVKAEEVRSVVGNMFPTDQIAKFTPAQIQVFDQMATSAKNGNTNFAGFAKALEKAGFSADETAKIIKAASGVTDTNTKAVNSSSSAYKTYKDALDAANKSMNDLTTSSELIAGFSQKANDNLFNLIGTYEALSNVTNRTADQNALLDDTYNKLSSMFPQFVSNHKILIGSVQKEAEQQAILLKALQDVTSGHASAEEIMTTNQAVAARNRLQIMSQELQALQAMLQAYKDATAEALQQADQYASSGNENQSQDAYIRAQKMQGMQDKQTRAINDQKKSIDSLIPSTDALTKKLADQTGYQGQIYKATDKTTSATDKSSKSQQQATYTANKLEQQLNAVNTAYEEQNKLLNKYSQYSDQYQKGLDNEIKLLKEKDAILKEQAKSLDQQIKSGNVVNYGVNTYTTTSSSGSSGGSSRGSSGGGAVTGRYSTEINTAARNYGIDPSLVWAVASQESGVGRASSNVMQVNGMNGKGATASINAGARMLADLLKKTNGNMDEALAAYNMGAGILPYFDSHGGYSQANMQAFSDMQKQKHGYKVYGDPNYVNHVLRYYNGDTSSSSSGSSSGQSASEKAANKQQAIDQAKSDYLNTQQAIIDNEDALQQLYLAKVQARLAKFDHEKNGLQDDFALIDLKQEQVNQNSKEWADLQEQKIKLMDKEKKYDEEAIAYEKDQIKNNKDLTAAQRDFLKDDLVQRTTDLYNLEKDITDARIEMADKVVEAYKQALQAQEKIATDAIDKQIKDIQDKQSKDQYNKDLADKQKSKQDIQDQLNALALDNSASANAKRKDLQGQLNQANSDIQDTVDQHNTDQRIQNLNDQKDAVTKHFDEMINDETAMAKIRSDILKGNTKDLSKQLTDFYTMVKKNTKDLGKDISDNLLQLLDQARQWLKDDQSNTKSSSKSSGKSSGKSIPKHHDGGIVGSTPSTNNRLTEIANQLFNVQPGEQVIKSLIGELQVPPKNIPNLFTNINNLVGKLNPNQAIVGGDTYHLTLNIKEFSGSKNDVNSALQKIYDGVKRMGGGKLK